MTVKARRPVSIFPRVVAEVGRVSELLLGDVGAKTTKRPVKGESTPWNGIVAVAEPHEAAKAHDRVGDAARDFVDNEVVDFANVFSSCP